MVPFLMLPALPLDQQRITEAAWDRKIDPLAKAKFYLGDEPLPANCEKKENESDITLAYCH